MTETQREAVPRNDGGELDTTLAFLSFVRGCVLKKADGLDEEQLRRPVVASGTNIVGLVQHLTDCERFWVGYVFAGQQQHEDVDFSMQVGEGTSSDQVLGAYRAAISASDAVIASSEGLDALAAETVDGDRLSLRWVLTHLVGETTRHAGHADIARELVDGTTADRRGHHDPGPRPPARTRRAHRRTGVGVGGRPLARAGDRAHRGAQPGRQPRSRR